MVKNYFLFYVLFFAAAAALLPSCNKLNPPEVIPAYGNVDKIALTTTSPATTGSVSTLGITDAWIYVDDNPVGAFQMPTTFPIVASSGTHNVIIFAGIKDDGQSGQRTKYPFFTAYNVNANLTQGSTTVFKPSITYQSWTDFAWMVDFDGGFSSLSKDNTSGVSDTSVVITNSPEPVFEGTHSGAVYLTAKKSHFRGVSDTLILRNDGNPVYLEMNYMTNTIFTVGLISEARSPGYVTPIVYVDTSSSWKKMYVNISQTLQTSGSDSYRIYFQMSIDTNKQKSATLYLDNLKLLRHK